MTSRYALFGIGLAWLLGADAAETPQLSLEDRVPGIETHPIQEPVFGGRAYVYELGKDNARTIVLVHGIGNDGPLDYADQIPWLARSFHIVAVELPGFGRSDKTNALYSPTNYVAFLKHVTERFAHRPFVLVGHSMGGVVSLRYAALYPKDLERLVVVDAPGILHRFAFSSHYLAHLGIDFLPPAADPLPKIAILARNLLGRMEQSRFDLDTILQRPTMRASMLGSDPAKIAGLAVALEDLSQEIPEIQVETLVIWGGRDTVAPLRAGKVLAQKLPRAQLVVIERAEHVPMQETPDRFRAVLENFLAHGRAPTPPAPALKKHGDVRCDRKRNMVYEGEYGLLALYGCKDVRIVNARVRELRLEDATAKIEDSDVGGGEVAIYARASTLEMTGGRIAGETAIVAYGSRFDFAAVQLEARELLIKSPQGSSVAFSLCRVRGPKTNGEVHGYYAVTEEKPLQ